jgi:hypothetical protein
MRRAVLWLLAAALLLAGCAAPVAAWKTAYYDALMTRLSEQLPPMIDYLTLCDIDFDGVPEMFLSSLGTFNLVICLGYSFRNGEAEKIDFSEDGAIPAGLALYQNKQTGEKLWLAADTFRDGPGYYYYWMVSLDFSDIGSVRAETFFHYAEDFRDVPATGERYDGDPVYRYYHDGVEEELPLEEIERLKTEKLAPYEELETRAYSKFVYELLKGDAYDLSPEALDRELFLKFLDCWQDA